MSQARFGKASPVRNWGRSIYSSCHTTTFAYDALSRVTQTTFPSTLVESYAYDAIGNLTSKTDRKKTIRQQRQHTDQDRLHGYDST
jgi:YD repeat-containing protein